MKSFEDILNRNHRVELDKAWEGSYTRRGIIAMGTYLAAATFMKSIGIDAFLLNALVPTGGYLFSTLSLSIVKGWWIQRQESFSQPDFRKMEKRDINGNEPKVVETKQYGE